MKNPSRSRKTPSGRAELAETWDLSNGGGNAVSGHSGAFRNDSEDGRAPFDTECLDVWPPQTLSRPAMEAYRALEAKGLIELAAVQVGRHTGSVKIRYRTQIPHEWILQELKDEKCKIAIGGEEHKWKIKVEHA